jgi:hypothetical protein
VEKLLNKKILFIFALTIMFSSIAFAEISVERKTEAVLPGEETEITLTIGLGGEEPSSLIITEDIPDGWELVEEGSGTQFGSKLKFLLYDVTLKDGKKVTYSLKAPQNFSLAQAVFGQWKTLEASGIVEGDGVIKLAQSEPEPVPEPEQQGFDMNLLIIGGIAVVIILLIMLVLKKKK